MITPAPRSAVFSIRDLAREFDVTARTLRYYEAKGLLSPLRRGQSRLYTANDRARLALILRGKRVGFTLDEIREMLNLEAIGEGGHRLMQEAIPRFERRIEALTRQRDDIDHALRDLEAGLGWLRTRLEGRDAPPDLRARAAAFEALAKTWLYGGEEVAATD